MLLLHLVALSVLCFPRAVRSGLRRRWADVTLFKGAYRNVLVAISREVPEDFELIENIKERFREASTELALATGGRVRFGHVDILVPASWNNTTSSWATDQRFDNADFIVAPPKQIQGDAPYTKRLGGCGKRGEFVHITPKYIKDSTYAKRWGPPSKTLVHEWAHYWWGVFDEYPTLTKQSYTNLNGLTAPIMCPEDFPGKWLTAPGGVSCEAGMEGCRFIPTDPPQAGPSFMAFYHLSNVTTFCNETGEHPHNIFAPTKHNRMCSRRSVWSVIEQHVDFHIPKGILGTTPSTGTSVAKGGKMLAGTAPGIMTIPDSGQEVPKSSSSSGKVGQSDASITFNVVKRIQRVLFALDKQMKPSDQYLMKTSIKEFIATTQVDSQVAVVYFGHSTNLCPVMRWSYVANISENGLDSPDSPSCNESTNYTTSCIGDALSASLKYISKVAKTKAGTIIVLLTPAKQASSKDKHCSVKLDDSLQRLEQQLVTLHVVLTGEGKVTSTIRQAAETTHGRSLKLQRNGNETSTLSRLLAPDKYGSQTKIQLVKKRDTAAVGHAVSGCLYVDTSCGRELVFRFGQLNTQLTYNVTVRSPAGLNYTSSKRTEDAGTIAVDVNTTEVGMWHYTVHSDQGNKGLAVQTLLECEPASNAVDIQVTPLMNLNRVNFADTDTEYLILAAQVTADGLPIQNATVIATVTLANGSTLDVSLRDNGAGADMDIGDGVYAAYFVDYAGNGTYSVDIAAKRTTPTSTSGQQPHDSAFDVFQNQTSKKATTANVPAFQRTTESPPFSVDNLPPGDVDLFPPATVTDLDFEVNSFDDRTIELKFTAQGDDLDSGTASSYDIRYVALTKYSGAAERLRQLRNNFNSCSVLEYTGTPLSAGYTEHMTQNFSEYAHVELIMIALRVIDDTDQSSDVSNIVVVNFRRVTTTTSLTTAPASVTPVGTSYSTNSSNADAASNTIQLTLAQLILVVVAAVALTTLLCICLLCFVFQCKKFGSAQSPSSSRDIELQDPANLADTRTGDQRQRDNDYVATKNASHDISGAKSHANKDFTPRPQPVGMSDGNHMAEERRHVGVGKRISRLFASINPAKANSRASGSYATSIEPTTSDSFRKNSNNPPLNSIREESQNVASRIDPEGDVRIMPILSPKTTNPTGTYVKTPPPPPPQPRTQLSDQNGIYVNTHRQIQGAVRLNPSSESSMIYDIIPEKTPHIDAASSSNSSESDYQDNIDPTPRTTPACLRIHPVGAENEGDTPASPAGLARNNVTRESWAIDRSSLYREIDMSCRPPVEGMPNLGVFAPQTGPRFRPLLAAPRHLGDPLLMSQPR